MVLTGSCPWPEPWFRTYGAHLHMQAREDPIPTVDAVPSASMAGFDPATQCARVCGRRRVFSLADARWLGGRLKGGHGECGYEREMNPKIDLRASARARRASLARACPDFATRIASYTDDIGIAPGAAVSFYWPMGDEADPRALAARLAARGHRLALPVVVKKDAPLVFRLWRESDPLVVHAFGMHEPASSASEVTPDVLLVPLLAFDARGHRLGYGGGFYDRTLASLAAKRAVGVAYAGQETAALPTHDRDHPLDMVVTELGVRRFGTSTG